MIPLLPELHLQATRRVVKVLGPRCTQEARQEGTSTCKQVLQLSVGSLLAQIQGQLAAAAECGAAGGGQCGPRLALYSAHDATLMPLMAGGSFFIAVVYGRSVGMGQACAGTAPTAWLISMAVCARKHDYWMWGWLDRDGDDYAPIFAI